MISLIIILALGWLLYKALFPEVAPYYGKDLPDDIPILRYRSPRLYAGYDFISPDPLYENPENILIEPCHPGYVGDFQESEPYWLDLKEFHEIEGIGINEETMRLLQEERLRFEEDDRRMMEGLTAELMIDHSSFHYDDYLIESHEHFMDNDPCHNSFGDVDW